MALFRKLAVLAGAAGAAQQYVKRNPEKINRLADQAGRFVDRRTGGRYHDQIDTAVRKVRQSTGRASFGDQQPHRPAP